MGLIVLDVLERLGLVRSDILNVFGMNLVVFVLLGLVNTILVDRP